jgi:AraC-like DNA-binding protein
VLAAPPFVRPNPSTQDYPSSLESYLQYCFAACTPPRVDELAHFLRMHPSALSRHFKAKTGRKLSTVLRERQIGEAKRLLAFTRMRTSDVARRAGFGTPNTLFRVFRVHVGVTPEEFRRASSG